MKLNCINCGSPIPAENLNIEKMVAACPNCSEVFSFQIPARKAKKVSQPTDITIAEGRDHVQITVEPSGAIGNKRLQFAAGIFFMTLAAGLYVAAVEANGGVADSSAWLHMGAVFIPLMLIMLGVIYQVIATTWNEAQITLNDRELQVKHRPFPMFNNRRIECSQINEVQVKEMFIHSDDTRYHVDATLKDGSTVRLLSERKRDHAYFLAQELDSYLNGEVGEDDALFEPDETLNPQISRLQTRNR